MPVSGKIRQDSVKSMLSIPAKRWRLAERLYAMAFNNSVSLELRKVALQEMPEFFARKVVRKVSEEPNVEYQSRLKLFLSFGSGLHCLRVLLFRKREPRAGLLCGRVKSLS